MKSLILLISLFAALPAFASESPWNEFLKTLAEINTGSKNLEGLRAAKKFITQEFKELGLEVKELPQEEGRSILVMEVPGAKPTVGFYGHIDTVFASDTDFKTVNVTSDSIHGPGVIDMKGGIALIREVVRELKKTAPEKLKQVRILINDDEEIGSPYSKLALQKNSEGIQYALIFEPGNEKGNVASSQSGINWLEILVDGRAAHAGLEHKKGLNACVELSRILVDAAKETKYPRNFTVNVGTLTGGTTPNIVCEHASSKLDIRYVFPEDLARFKDRVTSKLKKLPEGYHGELKVLLEIQSLGEARIKTVLAEFEKAARAVGEPLGHTHVGYAADSNHLQTVPGLQLLVGIGPYGSGMHSNRESLTTSTFASRLKIVMKWFEGR